MLMILPLLLLLLCVSTWITPSSSLTSSLSVNDTTPGADNTTTLNITTIPEPDVPPVTPVTPVTPPVDTPSTPVTPPVDTPPVTPPTNFTPPVVPPESPVTPPVVPPESPVTPPGNLTPPVVPPESPVAPPVVPPESPVTPGNVTPPVAPVNETPPVTPPDTPSNVTPPVVPPESPVTPGNVTPPVVPPESPVTPPVVPPESPVTPGNVTPPVVPPESPVTPGNVTPPVVPPESPVTPGNVTPPVVPPESPVAPGNMTPPVVPPESPVTPPVVPPESPPVAPPAYISYSFNGSCGEGDITESFIDGNIIDVLQVNEQITFLITDQYTLYRTNDSGRTWINQGPKMPYYYDTSTVLLNPDLLVGIVNIQMSSNPLQIFFGGTNGKFWLTRDGGETYEWMFTSREIVSLLSHPTNPNYIAGVELRYATIFDEACYNLLPYCLMLLFSLDAGFSWHTPTLPYAIENPLDNLSTAPVTPYFTWGLAGTDGHSDSEFSALFFQISNDNNIITTLCTTTDLFQTYTRPFGETSFLFATFYFTINSYLLVTDTNPRMLAIAPPNLSNYTEAEFPVSNNDGPITSILFADITLGSIFIALQKSGEQGKMELLFSDTLTGDFTLVLQDLSATASGTTVDFFKVEGFEGIFIANQWQGTIQKSVISFNKGSLWLPVNAPPDEVQNCGTCSLHFFGSSSVIGQLTVEGDKESMGVLLALGMVGVASSNRLDYANLYISRDAGRNWERILSGAWNFDSSVTANFIAAASWNQITNNILYTRDQGLSWDECYFKSPGELENHTVLSVATDLAGPSRNLWLVTQRTNYTGQIQGYSIIFMDFNTTLRTCNESDYEYFSPHSDLSDCVLGEEIVIKRRIRSDVCRVDLSAQNLTSVSSCNCSRTDYICTYCFVADQNTPGNPCVRQTHGVVCSALWDPTPPPPDCPPGTNYTGAPAYRRLVGTKCINELEDLLLPRSVPCPDFLPAPLPYTPTLGTLQPLPSPKNPIQVSIPQTLPGVNIHPQYYNTSGVIQSGAGSNNTVGIIVGVILGVILLLIIVVVAVYLYRRKMEKGFERHGDSYAVDL